MIEFEGKKLFIFDFDGTLFDTMHAWTGFGEDFVEYVGREPEKGLTDRLNSMPTLYAAAQFLHDNYCPELTSDEIFGWIGDHVRDYYISKALPRKGVPEFLEKYEKKVLMKLRNKAKSKNKASHRYLPALVIKCEIILYYQIFNTYKTPTVTPERCENLIKRLGCIFYIIMKKNYRAVSDLTQHSFDYLLL